MYMNVYSVICDVNFVKTVDGWLVCDCVFASDIRGTTSCTGQVIVKEFMQLIYLELRCIIEWAKKVPGWYAICILLNCDSLENLLTDSQMSLILNGFCSHFKGIECIMYCSCCHVSEVCILHRFFGSHIRRSDGAVKILVYGTVHSPTFLQVLCCITSLYNRICLS